MLTVTGTVVGIVTRDVQYTDKQTGQPRSFQRRVYYLSQKNGKPLEVQASERTKLEYGQEVKLPIYIKSYTTRAGYSGYNLMVREEQITK